MDIWTYPRISYRRCVYRQCPNATAYINIYALFERVFTHAIYAYMRCAARVATRNAAYIRARGERSRARRWGLRARFRCTPAERKAVIIRQVSKRGDTAFHTGSAATRTQSCVRARGSVVLEWARGVGNAWALSTGNGARRREGGPSCGRKVGSGFSPRRAHGSVAAETPR